MADSSTNPLISTARASDTSPTIQLHPLVLLTISDSITRHTLRQLPGPVVGAILGQQDGQEITMEVAFQAKVKSSSDEIEIDSDWFKKRLEDFRIVHKQPQLDLVGWFALGPSSGPLPHHLPIHNFITEITESPIFFLFHPEDAPSEATAAGKLPLTLYESVYESATGGSNEKAMDIDGAVQARALKFRELVYSIETGEAEMISVDFVARGGGNATAVEAPSAAASKSDAKPEEEKSKKGKGKQKEKAKEELIDASDVLTVEDEELLSTLTAKMNAIRMLSRRISLLRAYLASLPPSYLSDPTGPINPKPTEEHPLPLNHAILRSISATLSRTNILAPPDVETFSLESQQEASDVQLIALLSSITNSVSTSKDFGRKSQIVENSKNQNRKASGWTNDSYLDTMLGAGSSGGRPLGFDRI
ncbi:hypothetical protein B0J11DRAFT_498352 [Dendryphion nanum]|uniref:COP9 signalosome complex subunit 6 n=1 Tax=Dendryphion nanum TaxID=256645 RepID=A0A9P9IA60_9PLEO|nr:hypothetical protein B0J11DRAFT_498352 [Dendryphion nanum]